LRDRAPSPANYEGLLTVVFDPLANVNLSYPNRICPAQRLRVQGFDFMLFQGGA
jgi:hypothetical protein